MTDNEKLSMLQNMLREDAPSTELLETYLQFAKSEILGWRYSYAADAPDEVPAEYEMTQIMAVMTGITQAGIEGQVLSIENGIHRHFRYADMVEYIHAHVIPIAKVPRSGGYAYGGD